MNFLKRTFFFITSLFVLFSSLVYATENNPAELLKNLTKQILQEIETIKALPKSEKEKAIYDILDKNLVPKIDLEEMAKAVVGRNAWKDASIDIRNQFIKEFKYYVINTYVSALGSYDGKQKIFFQPLREKYTDKVRIISDLNLNNGTIIKIQYNLKKDKNNWKLYDFSIDGISLVKNYNAQFANILRINGLEGLVKKIKDKNER